MSATSARVSKRLRPSGFERRSTCSVGNSDIVWVHPTMIAEIEFRAWTADGKLRHAAYKGLRERQDNADVYQLGS